MKSTFEIYQKGMYYHIKKNIHLFKNIKISYFLRDFHDGNNITKKVVNFWLYSFLLYPVFLMFMWILPIVLLVIFQIILILSVVLESGNIFTKLFEYEYSDALSVVKRQNHKNVKNKYILKAIVDGDEVVDGEKLKRIKKFKNIVDEKV